MFSEDGHKHQN